MSLAERRGGPNGSGRSVPAGEVGTALGVRLREAGDRRVVALVLRLLKELRVHLLELEALTLDGGLDVLSRALDALQHAQMGVGMDGFRFGRGSSSSVSNASNNARDCSLFVCG